MNNVIRFPTKNEKLLAVENGSVFTVVAPRTEGRDGKVKNDGIYRKEGDSHCVQLSTGRDVIFDRNTLVRVIPNSRFAGAVALKTAAA